MRKAIFLLFVALGVVAGLLATLDESWGVRILMTAIGTVAGIAIGGALSKIGRRTGPMRRPSRYPVFPRPMFEDLDWNFWRDRGHLPFTRPSSADPDHHMFDPDKLD